MPLRMNQIEITPCWLANMTPVGVAAMNEDHNEDLYEWSQTTHCDGTVLRDVVALARAMFAQVVSCW